MDGRGGHVDGGGRRRDRSEHPDRLGVDALRELESLWLGFRSVNVAVGLMQVTLRRSAHRRPTAAAVAYTTLALHTGWLVTRVRRGDRMFEPGPALAECVVMIGAAVLRPLLYDTADVSLDALGLVSLWGAAGLGATQPAMFVAFPTLAAASVDVGRAVVGPRHLRGRGLSSAVGHVVFAANGWATGALVRRAERRAAKLVEERQELSREFGGATADAEGDPLRRRVVEVVSELLSQLDERSELGGDRDGRSSIRASVAGAHDELVGIIGRWPGRGATASDRDRVAPPPIAGRIERYLDRGLATGRLLNSVMIALNCYSSRHDVDRPGDFYRLGVLAATAQMLAGIGNHRRAGTAVHLLTLAGAAWREPTVRRRGDPTVATGAMPAVALCEGIAVDDPRQRAVVAATHLLTIGLWRRRTDRPTPTGAEVLAALLYSSGAWIVGGRAGRLLRSISRDLDRLSGELAEEIADAARRERHDLRCAVVHNKIKNALDFYLAGLVDEDELATGLAAASAELTSEVTVEGMTVAALLDRVIASVPLGSLEVAIDPTARRRFLDGTGPDLAVVIEELLTNVARHGDGGGASLQVSCDPRWVDVRVGNHCAPDRRRRPGWGSLLMARRVEAVGGVLRHQRSRDWFETEVRWPV